MSASLSVPDDRVHRRLSLELEVTLHSDSNFYLGLTQNLSNGGIFVATHLVQPMGTVVELALRLPTRATALSLVGRVRWVREVHDAFDVPPGMGIEFEGISEEDSRTIGEFLVARTPLFFDMT